LLLGIVVVGDVVFAREIVGDDELTSDGDADESDVISFFLTLFLSFASAVTTTFQPALRWRHLSRIGYATLEEIWKYRTRTGIYMCTMQNQSCGQ
jgi:hypothetical protein